MSVQHKNWTDNTMLFFGIVLAGTVLTYIPLVFPFSLVRFVFYGAIAFSLYSKGKVYMKPWLCAFPLVAGFIDVVPGLSLIPFVPSMINIAGIVFSVTLTKQKPEVQSNISNAA